MVVEKCSNSGEEIWLVVVGICSSMEVVESVPVEEEICSSMVLVVI